MQNRLRATAATQQACSLISSFCTRMKEHMKVKKTIFAEIFWHILALISIEASFETMLIFYFQNKVVVVLFVNNRVQREQYFSS